MSKHILALRLIVLTYILIFALSYGSRISHKITLGLGAIR